MYTRIKELRARHNLTGDLAKKVGYAEKPYCYMDNGKYNSSLKLAHDVAKTLNTTIR